MTLLRGNLLKYFLLAVRVCDTFGVMPFVWNKASGKFIATIQQISIFLSKIRSPACFSEVFRNLLASKHTRSLKN